MDTPCSIADCPKPSRKRGMCYMHYSRVQRYGDSSRGWPSPREIFEAHVRRTDTCWIWEGPINPHTGYGRFWLKGRHMGTHRWAYEHFVGTIPDGLQIDHLCRVRHCVNPAHMEPVTAQENTLRGEGLAAINARVSHCPKGHPYDAENTYLNPTGSRECRTCNREKAKAYARKKRAHLKLSGHQ